MYKGAVGGKTKAQLLSLGNPNRRKGRNENCKTGGDASRANDAGRPCLGSTIRRMSAAPAQKKNISTEIQAAGWTTR